MKNASEPPPSICDVDTVHTTSLLPPLSALTEPTQPNVEEHRASGSFKSPTKVIKEWIPTCEEDLVPKEGNEKAESFVCEAMGGHKPVCIITDQDPAMKLARHKVFDTSTHRFCIWHIMRKLSEKDCPCFSDVVELFSSLEFFGMGSY